MKLLKYFAPLCFLLSLTSAPRQVIACEKLIGLTFHNDSAHDLYNVKIWDDNNELLMYPFEDETPIRPNEYKSGSISVKAIPKYLLVSLTPGKTSAHSQRKIYLGEDIIRNFNGAIFVSYLTDESMKLSWKKVNSERRAIDCNGYIFDKYIDKAKPLIKKRMEKWRAYQER
ncbi:hypothetical protein PVT68_00605 [Microbulbifer bruguierae]|uniref:Uncharacterized protein n=1 Tax=Microbulbifer bruguierae TaxID=3029061 RepID=A0ABY8ND13_9GAMM|nr:hypothetical protein [Microbulbifer bruguierae]WGL16815.1 hypothetical protein PVT68_00605 [Microbulbifer bruguierae]